VIDAETLVDTLLRAAAAGANVYAEQNSDASTALELPAVIWDLALTGQTQNGPGLWTGQLDLRIIAAPADAWALNSALYDAAHAWEQDPSGLVPEVGWVAEVTDVAAINRPQSDNTVGKGITEYALSFSLALRS
jgi:hypothetical protein